MISSCEFAREYDLNHDLAVTIIINSHRLCSFVLLFWLMHSLHQRWRMCEGTESFLHFRSLSSWGGFSAPSCTASGWVEEASGSMAAESRGSLLTRSVPAHRNTMPTASSRGNGLVLCEKYRAKDNDVVINVATGKTLSQIFRRHNSWRSWTTEITTTRNE